MSNVVRFHRFMFPVLFVVGAFGLVAPVQSTVGAEDTILMPVVEGEWWRIADDDPDVSPFRIVSDGTSNTCDFTSYQDAQGMWHAILHF